MGFWSRVLRAGKRFAAGVIGIIADTAEIVLGAVKDVWRVVKPIVESHVRPLLYKLHGHLDSFPWTQKVIRGLDYVLQWATHLSDTALAQSLDDAIRWLIKVGQSFRDRILTPDEIKEVRRYKATVEKTLALPSGVTGEAGQSLEVAAFIADFMLTKSSLKEVIDTNAVHDIEQYMRIRAAQKLLEHVDEAIRRAQTMDQITPDQMFLMRAASNLLATPPTLDDADAERLDQLVQQTFGMGLLPFVFREMIAAWSRGITSREEREVRVRAKIARGSYIARLIGRNAETGHVTADDAQLSDELIQELLASVKEMRALTPEQAAKFSTLQTSVAEASAYRESYHQDTERQRMYVNAAVGFLLFLKDDDILVGRDYLLEEMNRVGQIIMDTAQFGKHWTELTPEEQLLIRDFANIFNEERMNLERSTLVRVTL